MEKELYKKLLNSVPDKFRKDVEYEIDINHMELDTMTKEDFIMICKWVLEGKKLHLRRVIQNASMEFIENRNSELRELDEYINKLQTQEIA